MCLIRLNPNVKPETSSFFFLSNQEIMLVFLSKMGHLTRKMWVGPDFIYQELTGNKIR